MLCVFIDIFVGEEVDRKLDTISIVLSLLVERKRTYTHGNNIEAC